MLFFCKAGVQIISHIAHKKADGQKVPCCTHARGMGGQKVLFCSDEWYGWSVSSPLYTDKRYGWSASAIPYTEKVIASGHTEKRYGWPLGGTAKQA